MATAGSTEFPPAVPTAAVGAMLAVGGVAAAGLMGDGRVVTLGRRALGVGLLGRAVLGGNRALTVLGCRRPMRGSDDPTTPTIAHCAGF